MQSPSGQVPCAAHPTQMTGLRCGRCGKPICPKCSVRTPVGLRCPACAGIRSMPSIRTPPDALLKSALIGVGIAFIVAALWRWFPEWQFYLCLALGFGVTEAIARVTREKRGPDVMAIAMIAITIGFVASRYLLLQRYGYGLDEIQGSSRAQRVLQLQVVPDIVYMAIAYLIAFVRFR